MRKRTCGRSLFALDTHASAFKHADTLNTFDMAVAGFNNCRPPTDRSDAGRAIHEVSLSPSADVANG
ncbi:hypothetical protein L596_004418 [Steinernema carpocapsae]|uniref:Uncharacterized protein n=1 Tax=Steinernema carpocapsae TaxID=34508 RepID=A0A4U8UVN5_STECR|nr:hypothetical protein L596_004418 [Steinernema carpocapsae]